MMRSSAANSVVKPAAKGHERRTAPRRRVEYAGTIERPRGRRDLCVVWDLSKAGARIVVPSARDVPERFALVVTKAKSERHECRVMWRTECQVGVSFME
jgi:hypothetical protein